MGAMSVRFTLKADIEECDRHVRFGSKADIALQLMSALAPKSGHRNSVVKCPLCAKSGNGK